MRPTPLARQLPLLPTLLLFLQVQLHLMQHLNLPPAPPLHHQKALSPRTDQLTYPPSRHYESAATTRTCPVSCREGVFAHGCFWIIPGYPCHCCCYGGRNSVL
ncbi:uncharacterized protein EI90DRAFT_3035433, partial [Cantharellus anzutake]|uniref:uncharacterized protein n=1 Tax=Cantharellus anzutake TaxID=1750568 RepID=UPI001902E610